MFSLLQDVVAGDGTTSVTVICGALLKKCLDLLERGVHPTVISDAFNKAADRAVEVWCLFLLGLLHIIAAIFVDSACEINLRSESALYLLSCFAMQVLEGIAIPVDLSDREALVKAANT